VAYLLDSNLVIPYLADDPATVPLVERLACDGIAISIITYMEVYQGTLRSPDPERAQNQFESFLGGTS
jgi:predicted nucleic acid-binding protein